MLMRINGMSGTITSLYGDAVLKAGRASFSYEIDGGMLDHYEGIQYHYHTADISCVLVSRRNLACDAAIEYDIARFGNVTVLSGYNQYGAAARLKSYLKPSFLLRSESTVGRRSYRTFDIESYTEAETFIRLDRFFSSGTTLRGQIDLGMRRYPEQPDSPHTLRTGLRIRIARSLGERWGIWFEAQNHRLSFHSPADNPEPDNSRIIVYQENISSNYNRIFLDDRYKYSSYGCAFHTKYLLNHSGSIQFESSAEKKTYDGSLTSSYWYLPQEGWKEWEWSLHYTLAYRPDFFPAFIHPLCEIYHIEVDASARELSYDSTGISFRLELY
jgi:hypothetical protein